MRWLPMMVVLGLLAGCAPRPAQGTIGFQAAGAGYTCRPAHFSATPGAGGTLVTLTGGTAPGPSVALTVLAPERAGAASLAGATLDLKGSSGRVDLGEAGRHEVAAGTITVQIIQEGLARGNFELTTKEDLEIRGSFDAVVLAEQGAP